MIRNAFTFFFLLLYSGFCNAQLSNNNLVVLSESGQRFILFVNGEKINADPQVNVKAFNISEGWCKLKAEFEKSNLVVSDSIRIKYIEKNKNKEITYSIRKNGNSNKFNFVSISDQSAPQKPVVAEMPIDKGPVIDNTIYGNLYKAENNKPVFYKNYSDSLKTCTIDLNDTDIKHAINLVTKTNDFENKYRYIEAAVDLNCYTVAQLYQLLNLLQIEMDKLKLAKKGYLHLKDRVNAKKLEEVFKFKSMKEDYDYFLKEMASAELQHKMHCEIAISSEKLNELMSDVKKAGYEPEQLKALREKLATNCLNTEQVEKLMLLFTHDREKMEVAKSAYAITVDKANYKILVENFQFSENKAEFLQFISK